MSYGSYDLGNIGSSNVLVLQFIINLQLFIISEVPAVAFTKGNFIKKKLKCIRQSNVFQNYTPEIITQSSIS